jgi:hypothetical protein
VGADPGGARRPRGPAPGRLSVAVVLDSRCWSGCRCLRKCRTPP